MDTSAILTVMIGVMMGLMWRDLHKRMERLEIQRETDRKLNEDQHREMINQRETDRKLNEDQHREMINQRETDRKDNEDQHREIINRLGNQGERIARIEGREEALAG